MSDTKDDSQRGPLFFIFITVMINSMGIGLIMPVMPDLLQDLLGGSESASIGQAAAWGGWLTMSFAIMQFLFSPTLGNLSDRFGRRPVLLISLAVMCIDYIVMALTPSLALLFVARIIAGISASTFSAANAFIADISPPEKRAQNFGMTGAAFGVGFILGPALGGIVGEFGPRMPFFAAAALAAANFAFGWFVLPESLKAENRRAFELKRANPFGVARQVLKYPPVAWMLTAVFIYNLSHYVYPVIWSYYAKAQFDWSPFDIGLSLAAVGVGFAFVQGYLIRVIIPRFGEVKTAIAGFTLDVIALTGLAFATKGWMVYALIPFNSLSALLAPAMQGLMANRIPDDAQGELQGAVSSLSSLSFVLTPPMMSQIFFTFTEPGAPVDFPGAPFLAAAGFSALALIPFVIGVRWKRQ